MNDRRFLDYEASLNYKAARQLLYQLSVMYDICILIHYVSGLFNNGLYKTIRLFTILRKRKEFAV